MALASMLQPLKPKQRTTLAIVARKAYDKQSKFTDENFDTWRRREAIEATTTEKEPGRSISEARNGDFNILLSHFENLAGNSKGALDASMKAETEEKRQIMHAIDQLLATHGYKPGYASTICGDRFGVTMNNATPEQLHQIRMTLKTRFARKKTATE